MRLGIIAMIQNEERILQDWISFHRRTGVTDFLLFDHESTDGGVEKLRGQRDVTTQRVSWDGTTPLQLQCLNSDVAREWRGQLDWVIHCDADELVVPYSHDNLTDLFASIPDEWHSVSFNWRMMGPRDEAAGVTQGTQLGRLWDITSCSSSAFAKNLSYKSACRAKHAGTYSSTHSPPVATERRLHGRELLKHHPVRSCCLDRVDWSVAAVHHYKCRSREEWTSVQARLYPKQVPLRAKNTGSFEKATAHTRAERCTRAADLMQLAMPHFFSSIPGHFNYADLYGAAVRRFPSGSVFVEIGVLHGRSAAFMLAEILNARKKIHLHLVDLHGLPHVAAAHPPIARHCVLHPTTSLDASARFADGSVQFAWIDAAHDAKSVHADIKAWLPKIAPGGVLAGHDYRDNRHCQVKSVVRELLPGHAQWGSSWWYDKANPVPRM